MKTPSNVEHCIHKKIILYYNEGYILDYKYSIWLLEFRYLNIMYWYDIST